MNKTFVPFNINESVRVRFTPFGDKIWKEYWAGYGGNGEWLKKDEEGFCVLQMHALMHIFGEHLYVGATDIPFETSIFIEVTEDTSIPF